MIEKKVQAGSLAAAVSGVVLWIAQTYWFKGGMPQGFESLVYLAVPAVLAGAAGYVAPHTNRMYEVGAPQTGETASNVTVVKP